jgi:small-conductance mechanosensitive channel
MHTIWTSLEQRLADLGAQLVTALPNVIAALIVLVLTWGMGHVARGAVARGLRNRVQRQSLVDLARQLAYIGMWIAGAAVAAMIAFPSLTLGGLVSVVGLGSVAIGFAFKDIFENFFAGILILWRFPFDNADVIECEGIRGRVEEVTVRMTLIRKLDGVLVAMPNAILFKNPVTVLTAREKRRISLVCSVSYGTDVDEAREVIRDALAHCTSVEHGMAIDVLAAELSDSSVDFLVRWWTDPVPGDEHRSRDEVVAAVRRHLREAGIEIPFPQRVLTFRNEPPRAAKRAS